MLDQILDLVKGQVSKTVGGISDIPQDKKSAVVETASSSLISGLKKFATPDKLVSLLGGGGATGGLGSGVVSALTSKLGLSPAIAQKIATAAIPAVMSLLSKRVGDASEPGFNIQSLIGGLTGKAAGNVMGKASGNILGELAGAVTGKASGNNFGKNSGSVTGDASRNSAGGIMNAIGNIFGKKK